MAMSQAPSTRQAQQTWGNVESFLGRAYVEGRKWAGTIDGYANLARRVLSAATPMLDELGAGRAIAAGARGLTQYDQVQIQAMDTDKRARSHLNRIAKAAPEIF